MQKQDQSVIVYRAKRMSVLISSVKISAKNPDITLEEVEQNCVEQNINCSLVYNGFWYY